MNERTATSQRPHSSPMGRLKIVDNESQMMGGTQDDTPLMFDSNIALLRRFVR